MHRRQAYCRVGWLYFSWRKVTKRGGGSSAAPYHPRPRVQFCRGLHCTGGRGKLPTLGDPGSAEMVSFLLERSDHIQWPYCDARQLQRRQARQNSQQEESRAASLSTTAAASLRRTRSDIKRTRRETLPSTGSNNSKMAPRVGFEPTTLRLTAGCSAVELPRNLPISCALSERAR